MSTEIRYFENRKDWRKWLADNFDTADGVWFVFPTKSSSEKSIVYNDAVEEALCFGWIDSTIKSLDKEHKIQRFTPRNPKSTYSQANKERLKWLLEHKMIHLEFEDKIRTVLSVPFVFPLLYLQPIITQYFIDNKSEIWLLFLIAHSKR